ncbi:MAG TPA: ATP-binding protein [Chromatiaceae bacterium]|nr:ATP-binding protein [Chromatiaceae bacterium]
MTEKLIFTGRDFELNYLDAQYAESLGAFCVVYGRRRVGKTRLLTHWLASRDVPGFYWLATDSSPAALLHSLSRSLYEHIHGQPPIDPGFTYYDWDELFQEMTRLVMDSEQKQVIILDEFTYAIDAYPDLPFKLQAAWDHQLKDKPIMLVLSGSHVGMMVEDVLAPRSPLYGRATGLLKMSPLPFKDVRALFPNYDIAACIALYSVLGGVPYYLERIDPSLSVVDNIIQKVMGWSALVQDEPRLLLHDHFSQPGNYLAIISQVAKSVHSPKEIAQNLDLEPGTVSNYLHTLVKLGLIRREVPATVRQPERSRKSRYEVADPYLRFYYRFLEPQLGHITRGAYQAVWQTIERHWRAFVGTHTFEELCREWVYTAAETGRLSFLPQRVGSHWSATEQIDVVAVNWDEAIVLYGECKWKRDSSINEREVRKLFQRAEQIQLATRSGNPFIRQYVFFSRTGFTEPARALAKSKNAILVDLIYLDAVLADAIR